MTDSNSPSHWDALVLDLGATPPTQEPTPQPVSPPPSQPITPPKSARPAQRSKQPSSGPAQTGNWDLIANELGVTPLPGPAAGGRGQGCGACCPGRHGTQPAESATATSAAEVAGKIAAEGAGADAGKSAGEGGGEDAGKGGGLA